MDGESPKQNQFSSDVQAQLEKLLAQFSGMQDIASQVFSARQGFYEKLILLNGATITLLFTVIGGLSHSAISKGALNKLGLDLFVGCCLFVLSIMLSLLHNHLNIATLIHMTGHIKRTSFHGGLRLLTISIRRGRGPNVLEDLPESDPEAANDLRKGTVSENWCRWVGVLAQTMTICGYVTLVVSLRTVIQALAG